MRNNKGFSLIEMLAALVILGILAGLSIGAYNVYRSKARIKAYDTMAKSSSHAMDEYLLDHSGVSTVSLKELVEGEYLSGIVDLRDNEKECS